MTRIDITKPQPCPVCGAEMQQTRYISSSSGIDSWCNCTNSLCGLHSAELTIRELNRLSLRARLGEVEEAKEAADWAYFKLGNDGWEMVYARCGLGDEHRAILTALDELEGQA